ncbi:MAG: efflux RND transporter permease subunit [Coxiellaceae bacterium]|nr:efflux RND transporter permease subunit [Coxiellaceae bacterium]
MNPSRLFILRPIATMLIMIAIVLAGIIAYVLLPIASLPNVDYPTIRVITTYPGASPDVMTSHISAPLEKQFGQMPGLNQMTSASSMGLSLITLRFDLNLNIDIAEQEVQAGINAAMTYLPDNLPNPPIYNKVNPADVPIITLGLTSDTMPLPQVEGWIETILSPKLSQLSGVGLVSISGGQRPAVRIHVNPMSLAARGLTLEDIRTAVDNWNVNAAQGSFDGEQLSYTIKANDQLLTSDAYRSLIVAYQNNAPLRLQDVATVVDGAENAYEAAWMNQTPAIILDIQRQPGANVISVADRIKEILPKMMEVLPKSIHVNMLMDRTNTIRASVNDVKFELLLAIALVVMVIFVFLRNMPATFIPSVTVPVSLIGTFGVMYLLGFSINNLTLMALTISTGFVVDDAIVMIENIMRYLEEGKSPLDAALLGSRQIGFTIISLTVSLIAVLIPLLFMHDVIGRLFREFAMTVSITILISCFVSLTLTPMLCARFLRHHSEKELSRFEIKNKMYFEKLLRGYDRTLQWVLVHQPFMLKTLLGTLLATGLLFYFIPKDFFPPQDTGLIQAITIAPPSISFSDMSNKQEAAVKIIQQDPAVKNVVSYVGIDGTNLTMNNGRLLIVLKEKDDRDSVFTVIKRLQKNCNLPGFNLYYQSVADITLDTRVTRSQYQYSVSAENINTVAHWTEAIQKKLQTVSILRDVANDGDVLGLATTMNLNRDVLARLGISMATVDNVLYDAFGQRQISTIYTESDQYHVVIDALASARVSPEGLNDIYFMSSAHESIPLSSVAQISESSAPLFIARQEQFPVSLISFNLAPGVGLSEAITTVNKAIASLNIPLGIETGFEGSAKTFENSLQNEAWLLLAAVICVYIVLGVLYESTIHPVTILSTLPSATLGALLALYLSNSSLNVISLIGIILLIGIVMKNAIMMIDFALELERQENKSASDAIYQAALLRFRPILMTTMASLFGAIPLALSHGMGAELREPLGIAIVGGLIVSQLLTLYTTPVVYILFDRWFKRGSGSVGGSGELKP